MAVYTVIVRFIDTVTLNELTNFATQSNCIDILRLVYRSPHQKLLSVFSNVASRMLFIMPFKLR